MNLNDFIGKNIMSAMEAIKLLTPIVEYSKIEDDEFVKAPELGFYIQSKNGSGFVSGYRIYIEGCKPYYPINNQLMGEYKNIKYLADLVDRFGNPVKNIPSIKIPGIDKTLPGKKFINGNMSILAHYHDDQSISYVSVKVES